MSVNGDQASYLGTYFNLAFDMGCGGSTAKPYIPHEDAPDPAAPNAGKQAEVKVDGGAGFTINQHASRAHPGDKVREKGPGFLPFVRYDMSAVPPQIKGGDHIYLVFTYSDVAIEAQGDKIVGEGTELKSSCLFRAWRKDGTNAVFQDGDSVFFEHVETGKAKQMEDVNAKFKELYERPGRVSFCGRDLLEWVQSETSGYYKDTSLGKRKLEGCIRHPMKQLAHAVRDCMKGWGTDDEGLITCLVHLEDFKKEALIKEYKAEFGRDIFADIKSDTSGAYERALCSLIKPAPQVWAEALTGAMKGLGTADQLLINFMVLAKEDMMAVRKEFHKINNKLLEDWIESETSGDYKNTLLMLAGRNSEDRMRRQSPVDTLKDVLVTMPATAIKRHTELYEAVYGAPLKDEVEKKCKAESGTFFLFTNWWKHTMSTLLYMPVELYVKNLWDAMHGWGTDEYTLTGRFPDAPVGLVIDYMISLGHGGFQGAAEQKEQACLVCR
eukprot:Skav217842  [mRNA]  locus=scaffold3024:24359:43523:+ [translate_table: standard]